MQVRHRREQASVKKGGGAAHARPQLHLCKELLQRLGHWRLAARGKDLRAELLVAVQRLQQGVEVARGALVEQARVDAVAAVPQRRGASALAAARSPSAASADRGHAGGVHGRAPRSEGVGQASEHGRREPDSKEAALGCMSTGTGQRLFKGCITQGLGQACSWGKNTYLFFYEDF